VSTTNVSPSHQPIVERRQSRHIVRTGEIRPPGSGSLDIAFGRYGHQQNERPTGNEQVGELSVLGAGR